MPEIPKYLSETWLQPPPGYKPGQTRAPLIWNVAIPLCAIAIILGSLRLYVRTFLVKVVGRDDWLLLAALIFLCIHLAGSVRLVAIGLGKHQYELDQEIDPLRLQAPAAIVIAFYFLCQCCVQCSILAFYLRLGLATISGRRMQILIYTLMAISIVNNAIGFSLCLTFSMVTSLVLQSKRFLLPLWFAYGSISLSLDLTIWSIPLPTVYSTMHNLSTRKKILLVLAFTVGMMSWVSAILRIALRKYVSGLASDPTYNAPIINLLYVSEVALAISCVSAATLRPLIVKMSKWFNKVRGKPPSSKRRSHDCEFGGSPGFSYEPSTSGPRPTGNSGKGGFEEDTTIVEQDAAEWKDDVSGIGKPQCVQIAPTRGTQSQIPAPTTIGHATIDHCTTYRSSNSSSGETLRLPNTGQGATSRDTLPSTESTTHLTNTKTNTTID